MKTYLSYVFAAALIGVGVPATAQAQGAGQMPDEKRHIRSQQDQMMNEGSVSQGDPADRSQQRISRLKENMKNDLREIKNEAREEIDQVHQEARNNLMDETDNKKAEKIRSDTREKISSIKQETQKDIQNTVQEYRQEISQLQTESPQATDATQELAQVQREAEQELDQMVQAAEISDRPERDQMAAQYSLDNAEAEIFGRQNQEQLNNADLTTVSSLLGQDIQNQQGEILGEVEELVYNPDGQIQYVVISVGGFMGIGSKQFAVPFDQLQSGTNNQLVMNVDAKVFEYNDGLDTSQITWSDRTQGSMGLDY